MFDFPVRHVLSDGAGGDFEQEGDLGVGEYAVLLIGLPEQTGRRVAFEIRAPIPFALYVFVMNSRAGPPFPAG